MTEQQQHLKTCTENLQRVVAELRELDAQVAQRREMANKMQGIIEYLRGIGVKLEEEEAAASPEETPASSIPAQDA